MVGARRLAPAVAQSFGRAGVQGCLILSQVGLLFPANHAPMKMASLIRLRTEATADEPASIARKSKLLVFGPEVPVRECPPGSALQVLFEMCACSIVSNATYIFSFQGRNFEL
jgi:hypothetical protein